MASNHRAALAARYFWPAFAAILAIAAAARLILLSARPGWDWDESNYAVIGTNMADHGALQGKAESTVPGGEVYLYHPPFYFVLLGLWFKTFGSGIIQARYLAVIGAMLLLFLLGLWLRKIVGPAWALVTVSVLALDGWLVFTNRVGWFENLMMPLGVVGLWLYHRALDQGKSALFVYAGLVLGATTVFKHVGVYFVVAALIAWLIVRTQHKQHFLMFATFATIVGFYIGAMLLRYNDIYVEQSTVQIQRIIGQRESRGALTLQESIDALTAQYKIFWITLVVVIIAGIFLLIRAIPVFRYKRLYDNGQVILFAWAASAVLCFLPLNLKLPHYFLMVLIPFVCYLAMELQLLTSKVQHSARTQPSQRRLQALVLGTAAIALVMANGIAFNGRFIEERSNAYRDLADWSSAHFTSSDVIITEESLGAVLKKGTYCKIAHTGACDRATYIITLDTHTQQPPSDKTTQRLIRESHVVKTFTGFKEKIRVRKLNETYYMPHKAGTTQGS